MDTPVANIGADLSLLTGVIHIEADAAQGLMRLTLSDGKEVTITRSPMAAYRDGDSFDVWLPASRPGMAADVAPSLGAAAVVGMIRKLAIAANDGAN